MSEQKFQTQDSIKKLFAKRKYVHFTTIKPPRYEDRLQDVEKFLIYLNKRDVKYWLVQCKSETDYIHYHGIVSYPDYFLQDKMDSAKLAYQRKVNRDIGFSYPLQQVQSIESIYAYIHNPKNDPQKEYHTI